MTWGTEQRPVNWSALWDNVLTFLSIAILVLSLLNVAAGKGDTVTAFAARFWHLWGGVLRTVARTAGQGALQAEAAYWTAIEKVRG